MAERVSAKKNACGACRVTDGVCLSSSNLDVFSFVLVAGVIVLGTAGATILHIIHLWGMSRRDKCNTLKFNIKDKKAKESVSKREDLVTELKSHERGDVTNTKELENCGKKMSEATVNL